MLKTLWWQMGPLMAKSEAGDGGGSDEKDVKDEKDSESEESEESEDEDESEDDDEDSEDENEETGGDEDDLDEASIKEAKNLYKLIKNPASQKQAIEILARSAGIQLGGGEPPKDKKEADKVAKDTVAILEEALGENLKWLAPKLASALDKLREQDREDYNKSLGEIKQTQIEKEVDQAYETLARETKGISRKFETKMLGLADKMLPGSGMSTIEYVRHLYTLASASGEGKSVKQRLAEKINRNSKDMPGRIRNSSSEGAGRKGNESTQPMTALEAVTQTAKKLGY